MAFAPHKFHPVRYQSRPSLTLWKTQCAQSIQSLAECLSMECHSIDRTGHGVVLALVPIQGKRMSVPWFAWGNPPGQGPRAGAVCRVPFPSGWAPHRSFPTGFLPHQRWRHLPDMMGSLRVKGTAAPEVKFLDRCKTNSSAGVLQGRVRRSRARAWGSKMIRHRRSPGP